jgi:hypothetical protein
MMRAPDFFVLKCVGVLEDRGFGGKAREAGSGGGMLESGRPEWYIAVDRQRLGL